MNDYLKKLDEKLAKEKQDRKAKEEDLRKYQEEEKLKRENFKSEYSNIESKIIRKVMREIGKVLTKNGHKIEQPISNVSGIFHPHISYNILIFKGMHLKCNFLFIGNDSSKKFEIIITHNGVKNKSIELSYNIEDVTEELLTKIVSENIDKMI